MTVKTSIGEYKGHTLLELHADWQRDDRPAMTFGLRKAELVLAAIPQIAAFVKARDGEIPTAISAADPPMRSIGQWYRPAALRAWSHSGPRRTPDRVPASA